MQRATHTLEPTRTVRRRRRFPLGTILVYVLCVLVALITLTPFVWMVLGSLKSATEVTRFPPTLLPERVVWQNYVEVFTSVPFLRYIFNSFVVASTVTFVALIFHAMAGYSLARLHYPGRDWFFIGIVMTLMIPFSVTPHPHLYPGAFARLVGLLRGTYHPVHLQRLWDISIATVLSGASGGTRGGRPPRWGHARRDFLAHRPAAKPPHFGDAGSVLFPL